MPGSMVAARLESAGDTVNPIAVSWDTHPRSIHSRSADSLRTDAGEGMWVDTLLDHEGQPAAAVVMPDGKVQTIRLVSLRVKQDKASAKG